MTITTTLEDTMKPLALLGSTALLLSLAPSVAQAEESAMVADIAVGLDTIWVLIAAFLVFFMQAGLGMVEAGFIRAKNTCNILMKNWLDYCVASVMFFFVGYALMFGDGNGFVGLSGWALKGVPHIIPDTNVAKWAFWLFQAAFCGAAATIVAGGMAERMKFHAYLMYTAVVSAIVYPIIGHWIWGGGWLSAMGMGDFAGSTVVHATGGWIAFVGTIMLGPRIGKYVENGEGRKVQAIPGHNIAMAALGVFLLWFGWLGFNPGSALGVSSKSLVSTTALVAINTNLAAAAGAIVAMVVAWKLFGKPDPSMTMTGALAGLVAITAPCAFVSSSASIVIGCIGGVIVVLGVGLLDRIGVDDPVGAVPVHGMNGIWGTVAVGLWGQKALGLARDGLFHGGGFAQLGVQLLGTVSVSLFAMGSMFVVVFLIKKTVGLRVSKEEEIRGQDIGEHGMEAYAGFQIFTTQ